MSEAPVVLLFGASGPAGRAFIERTANQGVRVLAVSRNQPTRSLPHVTWLQHDLSSGPVDVRASTLVSFGPLQFVLDQMDRTPFVGRIVAISTASTRFKRHSPDAGERARMAAIQAAEERLAAVSGQRNIVLTLIKPTLIYGGGDGNVDRVAELAKRLPWVPVAGHGLRAPVHADDLARLAHACLAVGGASAGTWWLAGGETLAYPDMVRRIAAARGRSVRVVVLPCWLLKIGLRIARLAGRLRDVTPVMIERQRMDLVVDDQPARERLGWNPRPFRP
ncbi:MAG: hypothetical protein HND55_03060 [Pseudomonadota bacterium]|nr:MAG: hypothetical protein HND55_03060 [Pseudomonadota bacterium]